MSEPIELERRIEMFKDGKEECGLLFDVDGTLYRQDMLRILMLVSMLKASVRNPFTIYRTIKIISVYRKEMELLRNKNGAGPEGQIPNTIQATGYSGDVVRECVDFWFRQEPLKYMKLCLCKDIINLIKDRKKTPMPLGVYSDYPAADKLKELGVYQCFNTIVCSQDEDVKALKPSPQGFVVAAHKMGLKPDQVLYIGDRYDVDAVGAKNAGMQFFMVNTRKGRRFPLGPRRHDVDAANQNVNVE